MLQYFDSFHQLKFTRKHLKYKLARMPSEQPLIKSVARSTLRETTETSSGVIERYVNIIKSNQDKREYRGLMLLNRMKVLLVSDPDTHTSAAALDVNVGYLSDPEEIPGLAHFCEHMLFWGTEKYPEENCYNFRLSKYGGSSNAMTFTDHTTFYFDVLPEYLREMLDIFSQFFISPLFTESTTSRELNAVNSEYENNVSSDGWRIHQLCASTADPTHPYHKFSTGNRYTLETDAKAKGIDVRKELINFHQKWYSSNIMTLVVFGKESLEELETMVVQMFSDVEDRSVTAPSWPIHPFPPTLRRKRTYCIPVKDIRSLSIEFPIPDTRKYYKSGSTRYLSHLLGHEGPGSLLLALKIRSWCNSLSAYTDICARGFGFFGVQVDLTEDGLNHVDDIITLLFQYISMLHKEGPQRRIWEENRELMALDFKFKDIEEPSSVVEDNVHLLQELPIEEILSAFNLLTEWRPELIQEILSLLTPENILVMIVSKSFSEKCTRTECWYGTKYLQENIEDTLIQKWKSVEVIPELHLPLVNEFIPSNFMLETSDDPTSSEITPAIIKDTPLLRVWFKKDNVFLLPKAMILIDIISPLAYFDPLSSNLTSMCVLLVRDSLQHSLYEAGLAGLSWSISDTKYGLQLSIDGYDDKLHLLLQNIVDRLIDFKADPRRFEIMKENEIRSLINFNTEQPYSQAYDLEAQCLSDVYWLRSQLLESLKGINVQQLDEFVPRLIKNVYIECLMYGNLTRNRALKIANILETRILKDAVPLYAQQLPSHRIIELDEGSWYLREGWNKVHKSSCVCVHYACGARSSRQNVALELLANILSEPCFDVLRTKEQLGYVVWSYMTKLNGVQGLRVLVQHDRHHPVYVEERIEVLIDNFLRYLEDMSEEEYLKYRSALVAQRLKKPKKMYSEASRIWDEIASEEYNFDRARVEVEQLKTITKEELIQFYKKYITAMSPERRKLSVHVISSTEGGAAGERDSDTHAPREGHVRQPIKITDLVEFKARRRLHPLPVPYMNIPSKGIKCDL